MDSIVVGCQCPRDSCADLARVAVDSGGQGSSLARGARKRQWVKSVSPYAAVAVAEAGLRGYEV